MLGLLQAWLLVPALLAVLSAGCGLLLERVSGVRLAAVLVIPLGLATIFVLARLAMAADATAELATPLVVAAAAGGLWAGRWRLRLRKLDRPAALAALAVFGIYAAPVVLSGSATFAGYTILGDTAVHFVLVDRIASHGTDLAGLAPSSYRTTLGAYFGSGYPLGAHAALGAVRPLAFVDVAWAYQPFLAFIAAALTLTLCGLLRGVVYSRWRRAGVAALAAQPALVYGYSLQGSVKELATLWLVPLLAAAVAGLAAPSADELDRSREGCVRLARRLLPLAVTSAAAVAAIGVAAAVWLGPVLLAALWVIARRPPRASAQVAGLAAAFAATVLLLSAPTLLDLGDYLDMTRDVVTSQQELGNLAEPLELSQVFGIWLAGDHRFPPVAGAGLDADSLTDLLIVVAAAAALLGVGWLVRRRALGPLLFIAASALGLWYVTRAGSPWADAKALAIASPAALLAAALGSIALTSSGARRAGGLLALVLAGGVLASNALAYHEVSLAPRERLAELAELGERTAGRGPLLYAEFEEFGRHFLRDARPVGASEAFTVPGLSPQLHRGGRLGFAFPADVEALAPSELARFELIVRRRSPQPPRQLAGWRRVWEGRYYELWRKAGAVATPTAAPPGDRRLSSLVPAERPLPRGWARVTESPQLLLTVGPGLIEGELSVPSEGRYEVWLSGSFGREVAVRIDGRDAGSVSDELAQPAGWIELGTLRLAAGSHEVELARGGGTLAPGNGDGPRTLGPLVLRPARR